MSLRHRWFSSLLVVTFLIGCTAPPPPLVPTRIEISPTGVLLTAGDLTRQLTAVVFDQFDHTLDAPVVWTSSAPATISVSTGGLVEAHVAVASSVITATAGGAKATVLALAAQPVEGAVVVTDGNIVGEPRALGTAAEFGVGYQYEITIVGIAAPPIGAVLLTNGGKPVAGKVVAVAADVVTLEMVPIDEVFAQLDIDASIDLANAPFITPQGLEAAFVSERLPDGSIRLRQRPGTTLTSPGSLAPQGTFGAGAFQCKTQLSAVQVTLAQSSLTFEPNLSYDIVWNDTQHKIVLNGSPKVTLEVTPVLNAAIDGTITCKLTFREIHVPVPGPLGLLIAAVVPLGAGFEIGGKLPLAQVGVKFESVVGAVVQLGFDCNPDCVPVQSLSSLLSGNATPLLATALTGLKVELSAYAFLFANLEGGARFSSILRVEAIESAAGLRLDAKLASENTQAYDDAYASEYELLFEASIAAGSDFQRFLNLIRVTVAKLELKVKQSIATSPRGTVAADRADFSVGDDVTFTVSLDPATLTFPVIGHNVASVRIYRKTASSLILANQVSAPAGQTELIIPWVATIDGVVEGNFVAFVETNLFSTPRLELGTATAGEPRTATLTYTRVDEGENSQVSGPSTISMKTNWTYGATYQLKLVSETSTRKEFEIVSGNAYINGTDDYVEDTLNGGAGDCTYDEHIEDHSTTVGTVQASGTVVLTLAGGDYDIDATYQELALAVNGVWSVEYTFHGPNTDCRTNVTDPYEDIDDYSLYVEVEGSYDPSSPNQYSGSVEEATNFPGTSTETWVLQIH